MKHTGSAAECQVTGSVKFLAARHLNTDPNAPYTWESFEYHKVFTNALSASAKLYVNKCLLLIKVIQLQGLNKES